MLFACARAATVHKLPASGAVGAVAFRSVARVTTRAGDSSRTATTVAAESRTAIGDEDAAQLAIEVVDREAQRRSKVNVANNAPNYKARAKMKAAWKEALGWNWDNAEKNDNSDDEGGAELKPV